VGTSKALPFSVEEFQTRLANVRSEMKRRDLNALLLFNPENIYYLTGYASLSYFVYQSLLVTHDAPPLMIGRLLIEKTYRENTWSEAIRPYTDTDDPIQVTAAAVTDAKVGGGRIGIEESSGYLNVQQHRKLVDLLPQAKLVDGSGVVEGHRLVKSPAEIDYIREAARLSDLGIEAAVNAIKEGVTEDQVAAVLYHEMIRHGCEYFSLPLLIGSGPRSWGSFSTWAGRRIQRGDAILLETFGTVKRYSAALETSVILGEATREQARGFEAVTAGIQAAIAAVKPAATAHDVDAALQGSFNRRIAILEPSDLGRAAPFFEPNHADLLLPNIRPVHADLVNNLLRGYRVVRARRNLQNEMRHHGDIDRLLARAVNDHDFLAVNRCLQLAAGRPHHFHALEVEIL